MPPRKSLREIPPQPDLPDEIIPYAEWSEDALRESIAEVKVKTAAYIGQQDEHRVHDPIETESEDLRDATIKSLQKEIKRQHSLIRDVYALYTPADFAAMPKETLEASMENVQRMMVAIGGAVPAGIAVEDSQTLTNGKGEEETQEERQECKGTHSGRSATLPFGPEIPGPYNGLYPRVIDAVVANRLPSAGTTPRRQASTTDGSTSGPAEVGWSPIELATIPADMNASGSTEPASRLGTSRLRESLEAGIEELKAQLRDLGAEPVVSRKNKKKTAARKRRSGSNVEGSM